MGTLYATTCILLIFSLSQNTIINAETQHKRSPLGFQGVRGKRSNISPESSELTKSVNDIVSNNLPPNGDVTVTLTPSDNNRINEYHDEHFYQGFPDLSLYKRAPMGFMGMRGKKDSEYTDFYKRTLMELKDAMDKKFLLSYPIRYNTKRAPSGFMGMRGKKYYEDEFYTDPKRAPSGFMGMRGKKENSDILNFEQNELQNLENDLEFYENLEAQKLLLNELVKYYEIENLINAHNENKLNLLQDNFDKRAPSGFMGMRGKKLFNDNEIDENDENMDKRDPSAGFFGMRGKKSIDDDILYDDLHKRAPMGFQGMRGKKDISNVLTPNELEEIKRAPNPGFFGMRGKKQPMGSGFFGTRGKKGPYEFRDKFVGVRGKKTTAEQLQQQQRMRQFRPNSEIQSYAPSNLLDSDFVNEKRIPSGFYGVRGKKWSDSSSIEKSN